MSQINGKKNKKNNAVQFVAFYKCNPKNRDTNSVKTFENHFNLCERIHSATHNKNSNGVTLVRRVLELCAALALVVILPAYALPKVYHVDVSRGNDGYPGTESEPFRTIRRASTVMEPGDKAVIHEGVYHEQIMGGKSGQEGAPITYEGTDPEKVILRGSVLAKDWRKVGNVWMKATIKPITHVNAFVMVDEKHKLQRVSVPSSMPEGSFFLSPEGVYSIRLWGDANPNTEHSVDVYELDLGFNAGQRWGGTSKKWIVLRNMTMEKYGSYAVSAHGAQQEENSHWELDRLTIRYNNGAGVFVCLNDWHVHDCKFVRNAIHGCQINGARVRFENNICKENEWFGHSGYGGAGVLIGAEEAAHSCVVRNNTFVNDGYPNGYGCAIYLEGRSRNNLIENNLIIGSRHAGIGFYGSSYNTVINNVLANISPLNAWALTAAFVVDHSREGAPTQSVGNLIAHNTVWGCAAPVAMAEPSRTVENSEMNMFVNNLFARCRMMLHVPKQKAAVFERNGWYSCPEDHGSKEASVEARMRNLVKGLDKEGFKGLDSSPRIGTDPGLRDPAAEDYHLKSDSPLIDAGVPLEKVGIDKDGKPRPAGSFPDIGAYEYMAP